MKKNLFNYLALTLLCIMLFPLGACAQPKPLVIGDVFNLGPIKVEVVRLDESTASHVVWSERQSGMKFVMVELRHINRFEDFSTFYTDPIFIEFSSGNQYGPPTGYYIEKQGGAWEYKWIKGGVFGPANYHECEAGIGFGDLNFLFQVDQNESLDILIKLGYKETATENQ